LTVSGAAVVSEIYRCGYVALVGRPNVGKSTLLNRLLGQKISITSPKPQTTRHQILGIKTLAHAQIIYVDTPGLHRQARKALNRALNRAASSALFDVDAAVFLVDASRWTEEDAQVLDKLRQSAVPVFLAVNKIDKLPNKSELLPVLQSLTETFEYAGVVPISARTGENLDRLEALLLKHLPESPPLFPEDQVTDRSERFLAAELIREKLFLRLGRELPYGLTVEIESFVETEQMLRIHGLIWVERASQKKIVVGQHGRMLKAVGSEARVDMEKLLGKKIYLQLWVKVKEGWADDERALRTLGYDSGR
jgi:GTP-binding protein Era